jgi:hypothetical protein
VLHQSTTSPADRIAMANRQIHSEALARSTREGRERSRPQALIVIDHVVAAIEQRNLAGALRVDGAVQRCLRGLEALVGLPVPPQVLRARNTTRLHGELLDWQESVREKLVPDRCRLSDDADLERADT